MLAGAAVFEADAFGRVEYVTESFSLGCSFVVAECTDFSHIFFPSESAT
jgi:hypothetical protein